MRKALCYITDQRNSKRNSLHISHFAAIILLCGLLACKEKTKNAETAIPATTTVTSADLKMRIAPNTTAVEIARLSRGEQLRIVQRSADSVPVGKLNAYWYKVTNSTGLTGWVYGAHLAVESDEGDVRAIQEKTEKKLREILTGRWEAATVQGTLMPNFVTLHSDGKLDFATDSAKTQSGKYEITFDGPVAIINTIGIKKPMMTDLKAKIIGETLVFSAMMGDTEYKMTLTEKGAGALQKAASEKPASTAPATP